MSTMRLSTTTETERDAAVEAASLAVNRGELVVIPTDTVYGLAADAFEPQAVQALLAAKGRGRDMPPPVLVSSAVTLDALATDLPEWGRALVAEFWPGPLTIVCHQQSSLKWDLGETRGTVAVRMPDHEVALAVLERTGPLAVSSANTTGDAAALNVDEAVEMLGDSVAVFVDAGLAPGMVPSTIVDLTGDECRVLRMGAVSQEQLRAVLEPLGVALTGEGVFDDTQSPDDAGSPVDAGPVADAGAGPVADAGPVDAGEAEGDGQA